MEIERPEVTERMFKNFDAALDFCRFIEPESLVIDRLYEGGINIESKIVGYRVQYMGSEGRL